MAKAILLFFGISDLIGGAFIVFLGFGRKTEAEVLSSLYVGLAVFVAGALLIGFARIITLLEQIAENTAPAIIPLAPDAPRSGNHSTAGVVHKDTYVGRSYTVHGDGMVVARIDGMPATWRNEAEFKSWSDKNPATA